MPNITRPEDVAQYAVNLRNTCLTRFHDPRAEYRRRTAGPVDALLRWIGMGGVRRIDGSMATLKELDECADLFRRIGLDLPEVNLRPKFFN